MKISRLIIIEYQQFDFLDIDFTYPKDHKNAKKPLDKICLIGKNGTGKTTIIDLIYNLMSSSNLDYGAFKYAIRFVFEDKHYYALRYKSISATRHSTRLYSTDIDSVDHWLEDFKNSNTLNFSEKYKEYFIKAGRDLNAMINNRTLKLLIYSPAEVHSNELLKTSDLPLTNLNNALAYFNKFPYSHNISFQNVKSFWDLIIYQVKKRESDYQEFLHLPENRDKTIGEVESIFNGEHPFFLKQISEIWNRVLDRSGLFFDIEKAKVPMQLNDNLLAYIKLKSNSENISFSRLSSGIRHYIFRLGYISSLYFNRSIKDAIALIDEPENSLFPDLLYDLVEQYSNVTKNTQFFYATHSPIIAAQFEPCERVILDFNENGSITWKNGVSAIGDDANDVLVQDFGIINLLGKEALAKWERYIELKILIKNETDDSKKEKLANEFLSIGKAYNF